MQQAPVLHTCQLRLQCLRAVVDALLVRTEQGPALRDALQSLFSEPRLPDNPYFYLASLLAAYVDQSPLWKLVSLA